MRIDTQSFFPQFMLDNPDIKELLEVEQIELDRFADYIELIRQQVYISEASLFLDRYEKMFNLEVNTALSDKERIGRLLAKFNTRANATIDSIKNVVTLVSGNECDITEFYDQYAFSIDIKRNSNEIINLEDIRQAVEVIKPAHLAFQMMLCWEWSIGLTVGTQVYKVAHDVCSDVGGDYDYCGETPSLSYLGDIGSSNIVMTSNENINAFSYPFAGEYPVISTLGEHDHADINVEVSELQKNFDYDMGVEATGETPVISTLGASNQENGSLEVSTEEYTMPLAYAGEDYCGEE